MIVSLLATAGAIGAVCRFVLDGYVRHHLRTTFPWATVLINVSGSLLLGVLAGLVMSRHASPNLQLILGTGFCGGYTTFSTASFESVRLAQQRRYRIACLNVLGTAGLSLGAAALGLVIVR